MGKNSKVALKSVLIFMTTSSLYAAYGNLYAGLNVAKSSAVIEFKRDTPGIRNDSSDLGKSGVGGGLFIGYDHLITGTPIIAGLEVGVQNHILEIFKQENNPIVNQVTKAKTNNSFTGTIRLGIAIKDIFIYGKAGIALTNWSLNYKSNLINQPPNNMNVDISRRLNKYGTILGGGIDFKLNENWAVGVDHTFTKYPSLNLSNPNWGFKVNPSIHTSTLRLMYVF